MVSHQLGVTITQKAVDTQTNEIPISTEILSAFDLRGKVVTTDSLLTQRPFLSKGVCFGEVIMSCHVGLNPETITVKILDGIVYTAYGLINTAQGHSQYLLQQIHQELDQTLDTYQTVEKGHGRIETRQLTATTALNDYVQWPGVEQVFECSYERIEVSTGQVKQKTQ